MPATQHYFANAVGSVDFVPEEGYLVLHWTGAPLSSVEFRALYVHARNLLHRHGLRGILADHSAMPAAPDPADRDWLLGEWLPQAAAETDFARYAVVPALAPEKRLHTAVVMDTVRRTVTSAFFDEVPPAAAWLREETGG